MVEKGSTRKTRSERRQRQRSERATTFESLAEDYITEDLANKRRARQDALEIRRHVIFGGHLPATAVNAGHVLELAKELKNKPATGRLILSHVKRIFGWAMHEHDKVHGSRTASPATPPPPSARSAYSERSSHATAPSMTMSFVRCSLPATSLPIPSAVASK